MADCRVERVPSAQATRLVAAWCDLAGRCLEPNVFSEAAFLLAAIAHLPRPADLVVVTVWDSGDRLIGLCPVTFGSVMRQPRVATAWRHRQATASFPMLDAADAEAAMVAILRDCAEGPGRPSLIGFGGVATEGATARLLANLPHRRVVWLDRRSRAVLVAGDDANGLSSKARKEVRRQASRLNEQGVVTKTSATAPLEIAKALDGFLALEAQGWKGRRGTAFAAEASLNAFARAAVTALAAAGLCRIDAISLAGQVIASGIALRSGDRGFFWKTTFDEAFGRFSPGVQLALYLTDVQHREKGLAVTDSCAVSGHAMIDRLWRSRIEVADVYVATATGSRGWFPIAILTERVRRRALFAAKQVVWRSGKLYQRFRKK